VSKSSVAVQEKYRVSKKIVPCAGSSVAVRRAGRFINPAAVNCTIHSLQQHVLSDWVHVIPQIAWIATISSFFQILAISI
jgi:hypothetical protein